MTPNEYFYNVNTLINRKTQAFNDGIDSFENGVLKRLIGRLKDLETDSNNNIKRSVANLRLLRNIKADINKVIINDAYINKLDTFLNSFDQLESINNRYFKSVGAAFTPTRQRYEAIKLFSKDITKASLLESGISANLSQPIEKILVNNITTGGNYNDLLEILKVEIQGDSERLGRLQRYTKQITTDTLNQFNANYNQTISEDLNLVFYQYIGGVKNNTRSYCRTRAGKYFHIKEIQNEIPQNWSGKIPTTNANNILINRGGYNCGHQYVATSQLVVPEDVIQRAKNKGYL